MLGGSAGDSALQQSNSKQANFVSGPMHCQRTHVRTTLKCNWQQLAAAILWLAAMKGRAEQVDFVRDVRPIFEKHCYSCHGREKQESSLRLDIKSAVFKGGSGRGPSIIANHADDSPLVQLVRETDADRRMPLDGDPLSEKDIAALVSWVEQGALWPDGIDVNRLDDKREHWSFRPLVRPTPPESDLHNWARNDIDRFVLSRLLQAGLQPSPEADRTTWLRRVSFDLIGLPPSPEAVEQFCNDRRPDAYERVVEELLNSPRYGERWAQHWLDVVRYADTHGFEVNTERPHAWPYRDYVIQALNHDTSYDRFIREQITGDATGQDAATGFLVTASVLLPGQIGQDEPSKRLARQDSLDEIVVNIGQTFLGLSIGCARCHDHKFDPISQRDYYSLQAFVAGVEYSDRELHSAEAEAQRAKTDALRAQLTTIEQRLSQFTPLANSGAKRPTVTARFNMDRFEPVAGNRLRFTILATNNLEPCIDELEIFDTAGNNLALATTGAQVTSSGNTVVADQHELRFVNDGRYGNSRSWISNDTGKGQLIFEFPSECRIAQVIWSRDRDGTFGDRVATNYRIEVANAEGEWKIVADSSDRAKFEPDRAREFPEVGSGLKEVETKAVEDLQSTRTKLKAQIDAATAGQLAFAGTFRTPDVIHVLARGNPEQPREEVQPEIPQVLGSITVPANATEQQRRRALGDWVASPTNPLTPRVMANRIWQGHFGIGLVDTSNDFGRNGTPPSHPELLDWLASEFVQSGWSIKQLHRLIVLSATYRQSSQYNPSAASQDADVRLLWRYPLRRHEAETIRDSMLVVSGKLNLTMGGPGFDLFDKRGGLSGFVPVESFSDAGLRRMIYAHKVRRERDPVFGAFDCPDAGQSTGRRRESVTPIQTLNLLNSHFALDQARAFAARVQSDVGLDPRKQIERAYWLAIGRGPQSTELSDAEPVVRENGLVALCRALFNSNEFLFCP